MRKFRYCIIAAIILVDQAAKLLVRNTMQIGESFSIIGDFFKITHISNTGGAIPIAAMAAALWYMEKHPKAHWTLLLAIEMIVSGGIGNLIDRIWKGSVTDFLDFTAIPGWEWIFNIADIAVCAGCLLLVLYIFKFDKSEDEDGAE